MSTTVTAPAGTTARPRPVQAFAGLLWRDIFVTGRELPSFLAQVVLQPLFLLFVLGKVLGDLGYTRGGFSTVLFPGIVAFTAFLTSLQTTALPLVIDFSFTKEIEDRLLAPLPTAMVAMEKVIFSMLRALIAAAVIFPLGRLILGPLGLRWGEAPTIAAFLVLGSLVAAALGLTLGTLVSASKINIVFALVLTPLLFTGSTQFPWSALSRLQWFQVLCAVNPLTYVSEGVRGAMVPSVPHIPAWVCLLVLVGFLGLFSATGIRGFRHRAID